MKPIGGGTLRDVEVRTGKDYTNVTARVGLSGIASLGVVTAPERYAGMFVVRNEDIKGWQLVRSVYHAFRQTWHVLMKYGLDMRTGEKKAMAGVAALFHELNLRVLGLKPGAEYTTYRRRVSALATDGELIIGAKPRRPAKQRARAQLSAVGKGVDRRGQANPGAMRARTIAGHADVLVRLEEEIMEIDPHITKRQRVLISMIHLAEAHLDGVHEFVTRLLEYNGLKPVFQDRRRLVVAEQCEFYAQSLERLDFHPYRLACKETACDLRTLRTVLRAGRLEREDILRVRSLLDACKTALTILTQLVAIERLIYDIGRSIETKRQPAIVRWSRLMMVICEGISGLYEGHLRRPVCAQARKHIITAHSLLTSSGGPKLAETRDALKCASQVLSGIDHPND